MNFLQMRTFKKLISKKSSSSVLSCKQENGLSIPKPKQKMVLTSFLDKNALSSSPYRTMVLYLVNSIAKVSKSEKRLNTVVVNLL